MFLQIGVDGPSSFHRSSVDRNRPGAAFIFADGKETNQTQQRISGPDESNQSTFFQAVAGEKFRSIGINHFSKFRLHSAADSSSARIRTRCYLAELESANCILEFLPQFRSFAHVQDI